MLNTFLTDPGKSEHCLGRGTSRLIQKLLNPRAEIGFQVGKTIYRALLEPY